MHIEKTKKIKQPSTEKRRLVVVKKTGSVESLTDGQRQRDGPGFKMIILHTTMLTGHEEGKLPYFLRLSQYSF
jgi:hypothetical protein